MKPGKHRLNDDEAEKPDAGGPDTPSGEDARDNPEKLKENREKLGVDDEHKTSDMRKHHRGTFP